MSPFGGRLTPVLGGHVCPGLAVVDTHDFEVVVVADATGLLIVPTEDFARRWSEVAG